MQKMQQNYKDCFLNKSVIASNKNQNQNRSKTRHEKLMIKFCLFLKTFYYIFFAKY